MVEAAAPPPFASQAGGNQFGACMVKRFSGGLSLNMTTDTIGFNGHKKLNGVERIARAVGLDPRQHRHSGWSTTVGPAARPFQWPHDPQDQPDIRGEKRLMRGGKPLFDPAIFDERFSRWAGIFLAKQV